MKSIIGLLGQKWHWLTSVTLLLITVLSLTPLPNLPEVPGSDKTHHLIAYGALMFPAFMVNHKLKGVLLFLFATWGGVIELLQPFVNRYGEWVDLVANMAGLAIGAALGWLLARAYSEALP